MTTIRRMVAALALVVAGWRVGADEPRYRVEVADQEPVAGELLLPIDPTIRVVARHNNNVHFGIAVDGKRLCFSPQGSIWPAIQIDGKIFVPASVNQQVQVRMLGKSPTGKPRHGFESSWKRGDLDFTQTVEVVATKAWQPGTGAKRRLDACRITYEVENTGKQDHEIAFRANVDILVNTNDGALFCSPTTQPGKVLNGVALEGKKMPAYLLVMERPNPKDPGVTGVITFRFGAQVEGPSKIVLTQLGRLGQGWDVPAALAGDSACAIFWDKRILKSGERRTMVWAYGGGIASNPENEGKVTLSLSGNLEPGRLFTITAIVEDAVPSQTLTLELPAGIDLVEGRERQPVTAPSRNGYSLVMWRGRVTRVGMYDILVRSSTGVTKSKSVSIQYEGGRP